MPRNNENKRSINGFFRQVSILPFLTLILFLAGALTFGILYMQNDNDFFLYALIIYSAILLAVYLFIAFILTHRFNALFVRGLYSVTVYNLKNIADNENALIDYPNNTYNEFISLNEQVNVLKTELDASTLVAGETSFSRINLDYIDVDRRVVTLRSFKDNLDAIIFASQNYRNALVELYYDLNDDVLSKADQEYLITLLRKNFGDYQQLLILIKENNKSIYMYFPRIDSISKIREQLEATIKNATINLRTPEGVTSVVAHFSFVCYPFSNVKELFPDLEYAKRQGEIINVYLPNRLITLKDNKVLKNSMNLNAMSKILAPLYKLNLSIENLSKNRQEVEKVLKNIRAYFGIDCCGIISYDEIHRSYYFSYQNQDNGVKPISSDGHIEKEFVYAMNTAKDEDGSYYFSFRSHANSALGRHLDRVGIESGLFYVLNEGDLTIGAIYFFNKSKEFHIDSYIQESFVVLCDKIATILLGERRDKEVNDSYQEIDSLLKLSEFSTYRINVKDYTLLRASRTLYDIFPKLSLGQKCYKTLYGLDKPCSDCPLISGNKKNFSISNRNYETSLTLANHNNLYQVLTIKNLAKDEGEQRYHHDLLINSYSSLLEALTNCYLINGKGYLLLLRIDNLTDLVDKFGTEGYLTIIRDFANKIKKRHNSLENIYFFNNQTLALLFTEYGQNDIINECEDIYDVGQVNGAIGDEEYVLKMTYLPIAYPRSYPNAMSVMKQAEQFLNRGKYELNKNFIYFDDSPYQRSACKEEFMLSVIEKSFGNKTFSVNLQPMVNAKTQRIFGAELLLRISDDVRNVVLRTDKLIKVAADHDKIGIISRALLDYISGIYEQYSSAFFDQFGFQRMSINTDYSFFTDENFYIDTETYINRLKLPRNFLAFEIPEGDIAAHIDEFKEICHQLKILHIVSVCDQYTGRYLSLEALKEIGFEEIKTARNLADRIDSDRQKFNDIKNLLNSAKEIGFRTSIVGVENIDQYLLLKDIDENALLQGFYLHRPLEKQALIEAIRGNNKNQN